MRRIIVIALCLLLSLLCLSGCTAEGRPSPSNPVVLTMWHVYGSQTESPFNAAVDEFNRTLGKEHGVIVNVMSVTSSSAIDKALLSSANGEPGCEPLPNLFTAYPRVVELVGEDRLLDWNGYFLPEELSVFHSDFLQEGYFGDRLLMLPIAKSTEAFFLNKTLFDKFSADTGITTADLGTMDEILAVSNAYYDWSGGQNFMQFNDFYHYAYVGMKAYGDELIANGELQLNDTFSTIWEPLAHAAIYGGICLDDGYAAARWKTIEILANIGSTADVLYQPSEVFYADNTTEAITAVALPYPAFRKDAPGVVYRGGGLFATRSEDERENYGACLFAKWLIDQEHNLPFVTQTGYLPVTDEGLELLFRSPMPVENENYRSLYEAVSHMLGTYEMYALPLYDNASEVQLNFEKNVKAVLKAAHTLYQKRVNTGEDPAFLLEELTASSLRELRDLSVQ